jgi:hypothetical protein
VQDARLREADRGAGRADLRNACLGEGREHFVRLDVRAEELNGVLLLCEQLA